MDSGITSEAFRRLIEDEQASIGGKYRLQYDGQPRFLPAFTDSSRANVEVVAAHVFAWIDDSNPAKVKVHNFVVAFEPRAGLWSYWCGDAFLEGTAKDQDERRNRADAYLSAHGISESAFGGVYDGDEFIASTGCNFYKSGRSCKHMRASFQHIAVNLGIDAFFESVRNDALPLAGGPAVPAAPAAGSPVVRDPMLAKLDRYAFHRNVILEGDKGWGKTWLISAFASEAGSEVQKVVQIGGHEGLESVDLVGHMIKTADGGLAWKDGKLSEAFRAASQGIKTLVLFDEVLRVRKRELSVLVASLAPHADGMLYLSTGRPLAVVDGIAAEEVLTCSPDHLWVVCTTNVGAGYEVDDMEEALSDRFPIVLRIEGGEAVLKSKLAPVIARKGFSAGLLDKLVKLFDGYQRGRTNSEVTRQMNLRHLCEIVLTADTEAEIPHLVTDRLPQWVDRDVDGKLMPRQSDYVKAVIVAAFGPAGRW